MTRRIGASWIVLLGLGVALAAGPAPMQPPAAKAFLQALLSRPATQPARVRSLIQDLGDDSWRVREKATGALIALGPAAQALVEAATHSRDPEVAQRARHILRALKAGPSGERDALAAAVEALLADKDPWLVGALVRLLDHPRLHVRYTAEYALRRATGQSFGYNAYAPETARAAAAAKWRQWWRGAQRRFTFPARRRAEPLGFVICGNGTPKVWLVDAAGKVLWTKKTKGMTYCAICLPNGNTIISDYGVGIVQEYDPAGKVVWNTEGIPLRGSVHGIERLANGNTLIAHTDGERVIEVDRRGKIVWTYRHEGHPASAQRLPNGNTLICMWSGNRVIEVTPAGKVVWQKGGLLVPHDAVKLPNGNVLIADYGNRRVVEVDCTGRIVWERKCRGGPNSARRLGDGRTVVGVNERGILLLAADGRLIRTLHRAGNPGKVSVAPGILPPERKAGSGPPEAEERPGRLPIRDQVGLRPPGSTRPT